VRNRIDVPVPGFYWCRLIRGGLRVGVRIWFGAPIIEGEQQDRSPRLCVEVDGRTDRPDYDEAGTYLGRIPLDVADVWPYCAGHPISAHEYHFLGRRREWAVDHAPDHPAANPRSAVDVRALKPGW
jgi:hypothetical protein